MPPLNSPAPLEKDRTALNWNATNPDYRKADALGLAGYSEEQARHLDSLFASFQPLLPPDEAAFLLSCSAQSVFKFATERKLRAVDISAEGEAAGRREPRIYLYSIAHLLLRPKLPLQVLPPETIFPHQRACFLRREVARLLSCTEKHVGNLRELKEATLSAGLPNISRVALAEFLACRELKP